MIIAVLNAVLNAVFKTAMIMANLISNPQFNIWNVSYITCHQWCWLMHISHLRIRVVAGDTLPVLRRYQMACVWSDNNHLAPETLWVLRTPRPLQWCERPQIHQGFWRLWLLLAGEASPRLSVSRIWLSWLPYCGFLIWVNADTTFAVLFFFDQHVW